MKTALIAIGGMLMVTCISNGASAHQGRSVHDMRLHDYMALSQYRLNASGTPDYVILHGPTNDPLSTATGGPSGGLPDSN